jgi:L-arabinokinase
LNAIGYYVSGHGFGHAVRSILVMEALHRLGNFRFRIKSGAPVWLFRESLPFDHEFVPWEGDVHPVQTDSLTVHWEETLRRGLDLYRNRADLISKEAEGIRRDGIGLVVSDIPPLPLEAAKRAGVPGVCIANFTWDYIYSAQGSGLAEFAKLAGMIAESYSKTTLALLTPPKTPMPAFPVSEEIPLIGRKSPYSKEEVRERLAIPSDRPAVLLSFGGYGVGGIQWTNLRKLGDFLFLQLAEGESRDGNLYSFSRSRVRHADLVRAADAVVTKPGYGICAECMINQTPMIYTSRDDYPETPYLIRETASRIPTAEVGNDRLKTLALSDSIEKVLNIQWTPVSVPGDGAAAAAKKIIDLMRELVE